MNSKTKRQVEKMKTQTFGVEIEMTGISRRKVARIVAKYFGTTDTVKSEGRYYKTWTCRDTKGRTWRVVWDSSIDCEGEDEDEDKCAELVTPILKYEDMEDLQEITRQLRHAGAKSNADYCCGVHIHIGAEGHTARTLKNLVNIMASHEALLTEALKLDNNRIYRYCKMVDPNFLNRINRKTPQTMASLADVWYESQNADYRRNSHYNDSRYRMLNLHSTFTKGTIEFRLFQFDNPTSWRKGGLHAGQLKSYIQLCLALSQMAKEVRNASPRPQQNENPKFAMRTWLIRLGFVGDEFKTAREFLTKNLHGDAAFRFGRAA